MGLRRLLHEIYFGSTHFAIRVRYALIVFDVVVISYFVLSTFLPTAPWMVTLDIGITPIARVGDTVG